MLISHMSEEDGGEVKSEDGRRPDSQTEDFQTANELFELMARNQNFRPCEDGTLTAKDLVLIYKNIDLGNQLMSSANELKRKSNNQYVETVVYEDAESESDMSEVFSAEDLHNVVLINNERIELCNNPTSLENTLCHKFGEVKIQSTSAGSVSYDRNFIFKDPYIKEQLQNMNIDQNTSQATGSMFPATLLDVICCKRLEDNYNIYMENIIKYVKNTINQLERISNGDYLTEKAKEVWKEVGEEFKSSKLSNYLKVKENSKVLSTSTSIPVHIERKSNGCASLWDEIVHSEVDIRSLSKILEKKIVLEVPKSICGTYKFFSKCYIDNLIIRCKKEKEVLPEKKQEERMDVVVKLKRSESGHVMSNIQSIMFLQTNPILNEHLAALPPPNTNNEKTHSLSKLTENEFAENEPTEERIENHQADIDETIYMDDNTTDENKEKIETKVDNTHMSDNAELQINKIETQSLGSDFQEDVHVDTEPIKLSRGSDKSIHDTLCSVDSPRPAYTETTDVEYYREYDLAEIGERFAVDVQTSNSFKCDYSLTDSPKPNLETSDSEPVSAGYTTSEFQWDIPKKRSRLEKAYKLMPPDELRLTIQRLNMQDSLPEDPAEGSVSPCRRTPTRNRIKSPYENKSLMMEEKKRKKLLEIRQRREKKKIALSESCKTVSQDRYSRRMIMPQTSNSVTKISITNKSFYNSIYGQHQKGHLETKFRSHVKMRKTRKDVAGEPVSDNETENVVQTPQSLKFVGNNPVLDDTMTEMMFINMKTKAAGEDIRGALYSETGTTVTSNDFAAHSKIMSHLMMPKQVSHDQTDSVELMPITDSNLDDLSTMKTSDSVKDRRRSPKRDAAAESKKKATPVDFRKSIDQLYGLINKPVRPEDKHAKTNSTGESIKDDEGSDSGTSVKHHISSSNPSYISFSKSNGTDTQDNTNRKSKKSPKPAAPNVTKIIINSKSQHLKTEKDKTKKDRVNRSSSPTILTKDRVNRSSSPTILTENPLKAISQLLHEFDNVQRTRVKIAEKNKKSDIGDPRNSPRPVLKRNRGPMGPKEIEQHDEKNMKAIEKTTRNIVSPRKQKQIHTIVDQPGDRMSSRSPKTQVSDIVDEYKEAKGEAVRGPPKLMSARLNSLAQPRKHYVQAQFEQYQSKYGKTLLSDRLQRLAARPTSPTTTSMRQNTVNKVKQKNDALAKHATPPTEKTVRFKSVVNNARDEPSLVTATAKDTSKCSDLYDRRPIADVATKKRMGAYARPRPTAPSELFKQQLLNVRTSSATSTECGDFDVPLEESSKIANKLHIMIDALVKPTLTALPECNESNSKLCASDLDDGEVPYPFSDNYPSDPERVTKLQESYCGPYGTNYNSTNEANTKKVQGSNKINSEDSHVAYPSSFSSLTDIVNHRMPAGAFQKRLRLNNLSLSPKQSMKRLLLMQSGDAGSIVVKSTFSQEFKIKNSKSDSITELRTLSEIQKSTFDWTFTQIPMQITTVGYGFSKYAVDPDVFRRVSKSQATKGSVKDSSSPLSSGCVSPFRSNKVAQCYKGDYFPENDESERYYILTALEKEKRTYQNETSPGTKNEKDYENCEAKYNITKAFKNSNGSKSEIASKIKVTPLMSDIIPENSLENLVDDCEARQRIVTETQQHNTLKGIMETDAILKTDMSSTGDKSNDNIQYTTSLDILVGLLNEIKNITTCQTQMTSVKDDKNGNGKEPEIIHTDVCPEQYTRNTFYATDRSDVVSITSLDKLRQLESNPSIYSYLLSNDGDCENPEDEEINMTDVKNAMMGWPKLTYIDKEISTDIPEIQLVSQCTNAPSFQILPISVNDASTAMSRSVIGVISNSSNESCISIIEYDDCESVKTTIEDKIVELHDEPAVDDTGLAVDDQKPKTLEEESVNKLSKEKIELPQLNNCSKIVTDDYFANEGDCDPTMKMKRDVLVTMYSILVFTVFAALSFPQVIYQ